MKIKKIIFQWAGGIAFGMGILIAGAEGEWFPWINFLGILILFFAAYCARKEETIL